MIYLKHPSGDAAAIGHFLDQLDPATTGVREGHALGVTGNHRYFLHSSIKGPVRIGAGLIDLSNIVIAREQTGSDHTSFTGRKRRSFNRFCASGVGVDIELPTRQIAACICLLHNLRITIVSVFDGDTGRFACIESHNMSRSIQIPVRIVCGVTAFLDVIGAGCQLSGNGTIRTGREGRSGNQLGASGVGIDVELPAAQVFASVGLLDDLHIGLLVVGKGHTLGVTCNNRYRPGFGIIDPLGMLGRFIYLSDVISTGQELDANRAVICSDEGRAIYNLGAGCIGVDIELPTTQVLACVGCLYDLGIAIVGIGNGYGVSLACLNLYSFDAVIHNPEVVVAIQLLHVVGTRYQTSYGDTAIRSGFEGRSGDGLCASLIGIHAETPTGEVLSSIGSFLNLQATRDFLVHRIDGECQIGCILG